ncbi:MAG TPA: biphenyl 2,3-dioxygenase [Gammaproteobacteria bacterium]|nr:biphenyl 2,3-dioxygenase [Gammaproteobacteria bacterium]
MTSTPIRALALLSLLFPSLLYAAGDMTAQSPVTMTIQLGSKDNQLKFYPSVLRFETGKLYKLVIKNPSQQKHYFTAEAFSRSVFTRKVQIMSKANKTIAEVKGHIHEIEVYPGGTAQWWFVPIKTLQSSRLHCSIKGHTEAGMTGRISIK